MEGSDDHYLYVGPGLRSWSIWSSLKAEKVYICSGSVVQPCPAHPRNAPNLRDGTKEWKFNKADDNDVRNLDWEEGGVVIRCSIHNE